jgi:hypothetical protein
MSKSPLLGAFAGSSEPTKKNKKNGALLLISGIALATSIGGVFAATSSININNGSGIEFGQGIAATTVCTETATTSMTQEFVVDDTDPNAVVTEFYVDEVTLETTTSCAGVNVIVSLLDEDGEVLHATEAAAGPGAGSSQDYDLSELDDRIIAAEVASITVTTAPTP